MTAPTHTILWDSLGADAAARTTLTDTDFRHRPELKLLCVLAAEALGLTVERRDVGALTIFNYRTPEGAWRRLPWYATDTVSAEILAAAVLAAGWEVHQKSRPSALETVEFFGPPGAYFRNIVVQASSRALAITVGFLLVREVLVAPAGGREVESGGRLLAYRWST